MATIVNGKGFSSFDLYHLNYQSKIGLLQIIVYMYVFHVLFVLIEERGEIDILISHMREYGSTIKPCRGTFHSKIFSAEFRGNLQERMYSPSIVITNISFKIP